MIEPVGFLVFGHERSVCGEPRLGSRYGEAVVALELRAFSAFQLARLHGLLWNDSNFDHVSDGDRGIFIPRDCTTGRWIADRGVGK